MIKKIFLFSFIFYFYAANSYNDLAIIIERIADKFEVQFNGELVLSELRSDNAFGINDIEYFYPKKSNLLYLFDFKTKKIKLINLISKVNQEYPFELCNVEMSALLNSK